MGGKKEEDVLVSLYTTYTVKHDYKEVQGMGDLASL